MQVSIPEVGTGAALLPVVPNIFIAVIGDEGLDHILNMDGEEYALFWGGVVALLLFGFRSVNDWIARRKLE